MPLLSEVALEISLAFDAGASVESFVCVLVTHTGQAVFFSASAISLVYISGLVILLQVESR